MSVYDKKLPEVSYIENSYVYSSRVKFGVFVLKMMSTHLT